MNRRVFMARAFGAAAGIWLSGCQSGLVSKNKPNIVVILADDLGYGDVGCYGCDDISTPAIDSLADDGVRFTAFYANAPECTPTRTAFLTGRYQHRVGGLECALGIDNVGRYDDAIRLRETHDLGLPVEETSIARMLKQAGYRTGISGKWHLGYERKFFPDKHGFDYSFGPIGGSADYFRHKEYTGTDILYQNGKLLRREGYMTDLITEEAIKFIDRNKQEPFFLYVPYTAPHTPYQGPNDDDGELLPEQEYNKGTRQTYAEMVECMDRGIGRILKAIQTDMLAENTVVIFASDNGANKTGRNAPYAGYKGGLFEGGIRVPCIIKWPSRVPAGGVSHQTCMIMDLSRSIIRIAGARIPAKRPFDGIDIVQYVETQQPAKPRDLFWRARRGERTWKAVRSTQMKYISRKDADTFQEYLFDLDSDPAEENNLITTRPQEARRLKGLLAQWESAVAHTR